MTRKTNLFFLLVLMSVFVVSALQPLRVSLSNGSLKCGQVWSPTRGGDISDENCAEAARIRVVWTLSSTFLGGLSWLAVTLGIERARQHRLGNLHQLLASLAVLAWIISIGGLLLSIGKPGLS